MSDVTTLLEARYKQLVRKIEETYDQGLRTKEQCEELRDLISQLNGSPHTETLRKRLQERLKENIEAVDRLKGLQARAEETRELLDLLKGEV